MFLRNCWYVAGWSHQFPKGALVGRTMLSEPIVLYRKADDTVVALEDRCCHRLAPLSLGRLEGDDLRCLYHGLKFAPSGKCIEIPGQTFVPGRAGVHDVNVTPFCPYPGSALFDQLRREGRIGALDDRYFASLASYSDLTRSDSWSAHVTSRELASLRWRAMAEFYGRSFALHPRRALDTARALYTGRQRTRLDKALHDITARLRPR